MLGWQQTMILHMTTETGVIGASKGSSINAMGLMKTSIVRGKTC
jgi:hypothetical protein